MKDVDVTPKMPEKSPFVGMQLTAGEIGRGLGTVVVDKRR
jgi:hypothetical protein